MIEVIKSLERRIKLLEDRLVLNELESGVSYFSPYELMTVDNASISPESHYQIFYDLSKDRWVKALVKGDRNE